MQGTSFADVIAASGAPRGSIYHHFPQGKQQLTREVARTSGEAVLAYQRACSATDAAGVVQHVVAWWRRIVVESGASTTCPLAAIVIGTVDDQQTLGVVRAAYDEWVDLVAGQLVAVGLGADRAARLARTLLAASQGRCCRRRRAAAWSRSTRSRPSSRRSSRRDARSPRRSGAGRRRWLPPHTNTIVEDALLEPGPAATRMPMIAVIVKNAVSSPPIAGQPRHRRRLAPPCGAAPGGDLTVRAPVASTR
ncbi:TetR/AcrR family transcriptional regulator [Arsenicicoccus piscis]|uniref:HTH tetR-type domain-containing protein n=1 Tax=Arsenicicoccus piscis TaxID=673954 RepID=A0ABQ6HUH4_9MICO|nr:TetR/AcrR family transcriptional regulator [Arsenicicoccus piscis]GMA21787.1 hypothetical protein GCM10025862_38080 [Arsenicicoccus piscis]